MDFYFHFNQFSSSDLENELYQQFISTNGFSIEYLSLKAYAKNLIQG